MLDIMLRLLCVWLFCVTQPVEGDNAAVSCGYFMQDWYPSVKPQSSVAPYALSVSDENGYFRQWSRRSPTYGSKTVQIVRLSGLMSEKLIGFLIIAKNEFDDEENGNFIAPFPDGVSRVECKNQKSQMIEVVKNSTSGNEWTSIDLKWRGPGKHPAGKITISASVMKERGLYWEGISVTLGYHCAVPQCANRCPNGYAKTKFGCTTCTCAGARAITGSSLGLLFAIGLHILWMD